MIKNTTRNLHSGALLQGENWILKPCLEPAPERHQVRISGFVLQLLSMHRKFYPDFTQKRMDIQDLSWVTWLKVGKMDLA